MEILQFFGWNTFYHTVCNKIVKSNVIPYGNHDTFFANIDFVRIRFLRDGETMAESTFVWRVYYVKRSPSLMKRNDCKEISIEFDREIYILIGAP